MGLAKAQQANLGMLQAQARHMRHHGEMPPIHVRKQKIIESLMAFKDAHIEAYAEAVENYRKKATEALKEALNTLESGKSPELNFNHLPKPMSFVSEYDSHIKMWELHEDDKVEISAELYRLYFEDEWAWRGHFEMLNSTYMAA